MYWLIIFVMLELNAFVYIQGENITCESLLAWECGNGECINFAYRCNGIADCSNGKDETIDACSLFYCADHKFRCTYGGCVNASFECNGKKDCVDNSDELTEKCIDNIDQKFRGNCSIEQFQCKSGECIPLDVLCDGSAECEDHSDETVEFCASKCCPPFGFRCGYGGCIDAKQRCDGQADCFDASDENFFLCGRHTITTTSSTTTIKPLLTESRILTNVTFKYMGPGDCYIHRVLRNGWIQYDSTREKLSYGERVSEFVTILYRCNKNYIINGYQSNFCLQAKWTNESPECVPRCSTNAITGISIRPSSCTLGDVEVRCTEPIKPGTIARINCRNRYERLEGSPQQIIMCQHNGQWSPEPQVCTPICGEEFPDGTPYVVGGQVGNITLVPWHVGIYKNNGTGYDYKCGGSIINARIIISAMHCFWDSNRDRPYDASLYRVAVGKTLLDFNAIEKFKDQKYGVKRFIYDPGYADFTNNYQSDVALLILSGNIGFEAHIGPICIPYGLKFGDVHVPAKWYGRVAGWGLTSSGGKLSERLKYLEIPTIDTVQCRNESPIGFRSQITSDKFCAGLLNSNVSVCQGDSGGGLVFPKEERNRKVYYLRGIVSTGPKLQNSCDSDQYTTFLNILYYEKMISDVDVNYTRIINSGIEEEEKQQEESNDV